MEAHSAGRRAFVTGIAPGVQTGRMSFSALRSAEKRVVDFDESSRETFAAAASMWISRARSEPSPGRSSPWPSTNYRLVVYCERSKNGRIELKFMKFAEREAKLDSR